MIYARPSTSFTALLTGAPAGLVGTLTAGIEAVDGTVELAQSAAGIEAEGENYVATLTAPEDADDYFVVWLHGALRVHEQLHVGWGPPQAEDWRPSVDDIAALLRARTADESSDQVGTFTEDTRPTAAQVEALIDQACEDVLAVFVSGEVPEASYNAARRTATLRTALFVEISYFPEQAEDLSPFLQIRAQAEGAMLTLINTANTRNLFGEVAA